MRNFKPKQFYGRALTTLREYHGSPLTMAGHGGDHGDDHHDGDHELPITKATTEVFYAFHALHVSFVIMAVVTYFLKKNQKLVLFTQWLEGFPLTFIYSCLIMFEIYRQKLVTPERLKELVEKDHVYQVWFYQEIRIFLFWIISTSIFLLYAFITKFRSVW